MSPADIRIERLTTMNQFAAAAALQDAVWSYDEENRITHKVFQLAAHIGGQVLGAYADDVLAGYAMSLPGLRDGRPYLHSHHLAVLPEFRNSGVGRRLKLAQRDDALARGVELMEWTFDPLETRNAHLNIARLGAVVRHYARNFYGESKSPLHGGLPTDRLIAEWWVGSERVERALRGEAMAFEVVSEVVVPAAIAAWKAEPSERPKAAAMQQEIAQTLETAFASGLAILG